MVCRIGNGFADCDIGNSGNGGDVAGPYDLSFCFAKPLKGNKRSYAYFLNFAFSVDMGYFLAGF